jgi:ribosomal protein S18 acetylase RimI-like enzyme
MSVVSDPGLPIRHATIADIPVLAALGAAAFTEAFGHNYGREDLDAFLASAYSEASMTKLVTAVDIAVWLAGAPGAFPVAFAIAGPCKLPVAELEPTAGEIRQLYVRAAAQGRQVGTRLLVTALDWLAAQGRSPLYVGVWSKNPGAQRLYARFGFEKVGEYDFPVGRVLDREFILKQRVSR